MYEIPYVSQSLSTCLAGTCTAKQCLSSFPQLFAYLLGPSIAAIPAFTILFVALRKRYYGRARNMPSIAVEEPVEVAIVGGGIIGLVLALGLIRRNVRVKIYEQARTFREIGAGVAFTANAVRCMGMIEPGIVDALRAVATSNGDPKEPNDWLRWVDGYNQHFDDPREEKPLFKLYAGYRGFEGCHRAHFLGELLKIFPEGAVEFGKRLDTLTQEPDQRVVLGFRDGTSASADAVIGCDGIKSRVRQLLLGKDNPASYPHYAHKIAYRGLIPMPAAISALGEYKARHQHMHLGPGAHILHFPVADQTLMNVVAFATDPNDWPDDEKMTAPAKREDVEKVFERWGPTVRDITRLLPDDLDKWAIFDSYDHPAPFYSGGRACLAGDAAHAASPHHGAGAGIGVEDALCLSTVLELAISSIQQVDGPSKHEAISMAFETFNAMRKERSQWLVESSRTVCEVYEWNDVLTGADPEKCFKDIESRSHRIWYFDIEGMLGETRDGFEKKVQGKIGKIDSIKANGVKVNGVASLPDFSTKIKTM